MPLPRIRLLAAVTLILCVSTSPGAIVRVSPEGDNSNGETWETAYTTVSTAVSNASNGDDIWIREGIYFESIDITKRLSLSGGFAGTEEDNEFSLRDWKTQPSVLDAVGTGESVIDIAGVEGVILDGIHLQNANTRDGGGVEITSGSAEIRNCIIEKNLVVHGGGVRCSDGSVTIRNSVIESNRAGEGGGVYVFVGASASIIDTTISHNIADHGGGGINCVSPTSSTILVERCLIESNTAEDTPLGQGGGILSKCPGVIRDCTIRGNIADRGGGLAIDGVTVENCIIEENRTHGDSFGFGDGGGIKAGLSGGLSNSSRVNGCVIRNNRDVDFGGGLDVTGGELFVSECSITGNVVQDSDLLPKNWSM